MLNVVDRLFDAFVVAAGGSTTPAGVAVVVLGVDRITLVWRLLQRPRHLAA